MRRRGSAHLGSWCAAWCHAEEMTKTLSTPRPMRTNRVARFRIPNAVCPVCGTGGAGRGTDHGTTRSGDSTALYIRRRACMATMSHVSGYTRTDVSSPTRARIAEPRRRLPMRPTATNVSAAAAYVWRNARLACADEPNEIAGHSRAEVREIRRWRCPPACHLPFDARRPDPRGDCEEMVVRYVRLLDDRHCDREEREVRCARYGGDRVGCVRGHTGSVCARGGVSRACVHMLVSRERRCVHVLAAVVDQVVVGTAVALALPAATRGGVGALEAEKEEGTKGGDAGSRGRGGGGGGGGGACRIGHDGDGVGGGWAAE